jgi:hypothetical protein
MVDHKARVSDWDREYFRRIGEFERQNAEDELRRHLALSLIERIHASERMSKHWARFARDDRASDRPEEFYDRARRLGLYRSQNGS